MGTGGLNIANNATLRLNNSFALNHAIELNGGGTIDTGANNNTLADVVSGTGALTKIGTGKLSLSGANSYNGGTVINGGILQIEADSNLGAANGAVTMADGTTLELTNDISMDRAFTLNGKQRSRPMMERQRSVRWSVAMAVSPKRAKVRSYLRALIHIRAIRP
ncbi:hypothetical protein HGG76_20710 [Ochrobactrum tritici]|uniref:Outer membrane autotransporter n=1 Tax=Brucella tritici TaxID=94626 RepID=A0A7X6FRQ1_9HYPH|nr:hypothetical protein [Brucella tritici]